MTTQNASFAGRGLDVYSLGAMSGLVVGGTIQPNNIFSLDTTDGDFRNLGHVGTGEMYSILCQGPAQPQVLMADYPDGDLWLLDPTAPWDAGNVSGVSNPEWVALQPPYGLMRPMALVQGSEPGIVWVGGVGDYGTSGGALVRVRLRDRNVTHYRAPFEKFGITALAFDSTTGWLCVAANGVWLWDVKMGSVQHRLTTVPTPWVMYCVDGVLFTVSWEMQLTVVDLKTIQVIHRGSPGFELGNSRRNSLHVFNDRLWGVAEHGLFTVDLKAPFAMTNRSTSPVTIDVGGGFADGRIFLGSGAELWSVALETLEYQQHGEPVVAGESVDFGARGDEVIALIKAGDTLTLVSVNVSCAETQ